MKPVIFEVEDSFLDEIDEHVAKSSEYSTRSGLIRRAIAAEIHGKSTSTEVNFDDSKLLSEIEITQAEMAYLIEILEDTPTYNDYEQMLKRIFRQGIRIIREDLDPEDVWGPER